MVDSMKVLEDVERQDWLERYQDTHVIHQSTYWLGRPIKKCPTDAWMYQELIYSTYPDIIIETGTAQGGSALFLASMCDLVGHGEVFTIDTVDLDVSPHPRVSYFIGSSVDEELYQRVCKRADFGRVMVILDSLHDYEHVLKEMRLYSKLILGQGLYMVVEDSYLEPVQEAIHDFLYTDDRFEVDRSCEKFGLTFHPGGYLRCK